MTSEVGRVVMLLLMIVVSMSGRVQSVGEVGSLELAGQKVGRVAFLDLEYLCRYIMTALICTLCHI